jgi:quercetin dioxygenase-like cupin family protein
MENKKIPLTIVSASEGETLSMAGGNYRIVISGEQTGGAYAVIDMRVPAGGGPGPHAHAAFQESFFVLEGEVVVTTESDRYIAHTGTFINIPTGGMVHMFKNETDQMARLWCVVVPSGLEEFFLAVGTPVADGVFLPPAVMNDEDRKRIFAISEKYGQKIYPPDYLDKR